MTDITQSDLEVAKDKRREALIERISMIADLCCENPLEGECGDVAYDLLRQAAAQIGSDRQALAAQSAEIERLKAEIQRLDLNGVHTCHDTCDRLPCVQRREIERLKGEVSRQQARDDRHAAIRRGLGPMSDVDAIPKEIRSQMEDMRINLRADGPRQAMENVNRQLEAACREAFLQGKDFAIGPARYDVTDPFSIRPLLEPMRYAIEIPAGPVERGWEPPQGWRVVQRPDFTEGELARLRDNRTDWQEDSWQDHCGIVDCPQCDKDPTVL